MWKIGLVVVLAIAGYSAPTWGNVPARLASVSWERKSGYRLVEGGSTTARNTVAQANYANAINSTGWGYLEVETSGKFPDHVQAYSAGYLEGAVTSELIYMYWQNTVQGYCDEAPKGLCKKVGEYIRANTRWIKSKLGRLCRSKHGKKSCSPYWHHVSLFYEQLKGLQAGYQEMVKRKAVPPIPRGDIFFMNIFGDMEDLSQALLAQMGMNVTWKGHSHGAGHCSALIKVLPGNEDLYASHVTWNSYQSMLRLLKKYTMELHFTPHHRRSVRRSRQIVPGQTIAFSGYPGVIYSGDDFNVISPSGLTTLETTIGNSNKELWEFVRPSRSVLEGVRATVANRLSYSGKQWTRIFAKHNSGTYNNQWMVVDYKRFKPGKSLKGVKNLLWILEQIPGHVHAEDKTSLLAEQTYWPSYNTPYFKNIFDLSGGPENVAKYGAWFSYDKTPRALIFKRDQGKIVDLQSMTRLMRYNNFQKDPLSACNCTPPYSAENAISARNDLNPKNGKYPFGALGHRSHGGTDMKLTNYSLFKKVKFLAVSGPTFDDLPHFQWSKADFAKTTPHYGHPDLWNFNPIVHNWKMPKTP